MSASVPIAMVAKVLAEAGIGDPLHQTIMARIVEHACGGDARSVVPASAPTLQAVARRFHRDSLRRAEVVGCPIEDGSWNMLLALFANDLAETVTTTSSAVFASGLPPTTALRHLDRLVDNGLVARRSDPTDGRRTNVALTPLASDRVEVMVRRFCVAPPTDRLDPQDDPPMSRAGAQ